MEDVSNTFCILPWIHMATVTDGSVIPCCIAKNENKLDLNKITFQQAWNSKYYQDIRKAMLSGNKVSACAHCYEEEKHGYKSHRIIENQEWLKKLGKEGVQKRIDLTDSKGNLEAKWLSLDLRMGNNCNLQCIMCRPHDSTKWRHLAEQLASTADSISLRYEFKHKSQIDPERFNWHRNPLFLNELHENLQDIREIVLGGGEPMIIPEHRRLLEACVNTGAAKKIYLRYHTNGTILPTDILDLWKEFSLVEVFLSIDGIGERNHYMRYPSQWSQIKENIRLLEDSKLSNLRVGILSTIHFLSLYYLPELLQWIEEQEFKKVTHGFNGYLHPGILHYPPYLSVKVYPVQVKEKITNQILSFEQRSRKPSNKINGVLNLMNSSDESHLLSTTRDYLSKIDLARGSSFPEVFPELSKDIHF